jgi:hypothetical protein
MGEPSLARGVRESVGARRVPERLPVETWVGCGSGRACHGCGDTILPGQVQYDLEMTNRTYRLHAKCHGLWLGELIRRRWWKLEPPPGRA